jgi:hypothetical protein
VQKVNSDQYFKVSLERFSLPELFDKPLRVPDYQRSYSWKSSHVRDLLKDIFERTTPYLMGTIILHENKSDGSTTLDIVDGQQRLVTLTILLLELGVQPDSLPLLEGKFYTSSAKVIRNTRKIIREFLDSKSKDEKLSFRNSLHPNNGIILFTTLILGGKNALDRAYTFFDSVNSKGKTLSDFDLLKAHHLIFIPPDHEALASGHNSEWLIRDEAHPHLFGIILRRLRLWSRNQDRDSRRERPDYNEFCSKVEPEPVPHNEHKFNRYTQPVAFRSWRREADKVVLSMEYPIIDPEAMLPAKVTQTIEGGDAFFLFTKHYHQLYEKLFDNQIGHQSTSVKFLRRLAEHMDNSYLQNAFRAVMLLYFDKFNEDHLIEVSVAVEHIISDCRWQSKSVRIEGTLTHVRKSELVPIILESSNAWQVCSQVLQLARPLLSTENRNDLSAVQKRYRDSMTLFYMQERSKIIKLHIHLLTDIYCSENKQR